MQTHFFGLRDPLKGESGEEKTLIHVKTYTSKQFLYFLTLKTSFSLWYSIQYGYLVDLFWRASVEVVNEE